MSDTQLLQSLQTLLMAAIPVIFAITLHEAAHGWAAKKLGDNTAYMLGRVSLNPMVHIDWIGTVLLPALLFLVTGFAFGWAKPVPVKFGNLRKPRPHSMLVAAAGPAANLIMAIGWAVLYHLTAGATVDQVQTVHKIASIGIIVNVLFMVFNLIPILPLDGGRILQGFLPIKKALQFEKIEPYGIWIVLALVFLGFLQPIISPIVYFFTNILA